MSAIGNTIDSTFSSTGRARGATIGTRPRRRSSAAVIGLAFAAAVLGVTAGAALTGGFDAGRVASTRPVPGEFRLGPGLAQPPGITVPARLIR